jgi:DNA-binding transcriptional regulator YhcF (GntR family)
MKRNVLIVAVVLGFFVIGALFAPVLAGEGNADGTKKKEMRAKLKAVRAGLLKKIMEMKKNGATKEEIIEFLKQKAREFLAKVESGEIDAPFAKKLAERIKKAREAGKTDEEILNAFIKRIRQKVAKKRGAFARIRKLARGKLIKMAKELKEQGKTKEEIKEILKAEREKMIKKFKALREEIRNMVKELKEQGLSSKDIRKKVREYIKKKFQAAKKKNTQENDF